MHAMNGNITLTGDLVCAAPAGRGGSAIQLAGGMGHRYGYWREWAHASGAARAVWASGGDPHDPG